MKKLNILRVSKGIAKIGYSDKVYQGRFKIFKFKKKYVKMLNISLTSLKNFRAWVLTNRVKNVIISYKLRKRGIHYEWKFCSRKFC